MTGTNGQHVTFTNAKIAVFFGDRRVTEWAPVNADGSSGYMQLSESGMDPWFRIYSADDVLLYSAPVFKDVEATTLAGDLTAFPGLTLVDVDESYLS